jgi:hypothetical protein
MNNSWLMPMFLGMLGGFSDTLCNCYCVGDYNRYSKRYQEYGADE